VTETCAKSLIVGLLGLIADSDALDKDAQKLVRATVRDVRGAGANLNRIWGVLAILRTSLFSRPVTSGEALPPLTFPDPLPPSSSAMVHVTRSGHLNSTSIHVANSAQLVPVFAALIDASLGVPAIREELERGAREAKERSREERERVKAEKELWEESKKTGNTVRAPYALMRI
jgi:hypothetical protein